MVWQYYQHTRNTPHKNSIQSDYDETHQAQARQGAFHSLSSIDLSTMDLDPDSALFTLKMSEERDLQYHE